MKNSWWGKASEGHSFNAEVAQRLLDAGWQIWENIEIPEILNQRAEQDFGDVDVLAWRTDRQDVLELNVKICRWLETIQRLRRCFPVFKVQMLMESLIV